jgi:hypothetical protein
LSPNPLDLARYGHDHLVGQLRAEASENAYYLVNTAGGGARVGLGTASFVASPANAGFDRRNLALTEEVEVSGEESFGLALRLIGGVPETSDAGGGAEDEAAAGDAGAALLQVAGPFPSPGRGAARLALRLARPGDVWWSVHDVAGRRVAHGRLGWRGAGPAELRLEAVDGRGMSLPAGVYWVRVGVGGGAGAGGGPGGGGEAVRRWVVGGR